MKHLLGHPIYRRPDGSAVLRWWCDPRPPSLEVAELDDRKQYPATTTISLGAVTCPECLRRRSVASAQRERATQLAIAAVARKAGL